MKTRRIIVLICAALLLTITACTGNNANTVNTTNAAKLSVNREVVLTNDNTNAKRNQLLIEDLRFFQKELTLRHKNLFNKISKEEYNSQMYQLIEQVDKLNNQEVFVELNKIVASVGDAHTTINYWDGYLYPLQYGIFDGKVYIVNAGAGLEEMVDSQVLNIDGVAIDQVMEQLSTIISHENESWVLAMLPNYLQAPVFLNGLGIVANEMEAVFTVQNGGETKDYTVSALAYGEEAGFVKSERENMLLGKFDTNYKYEYLPDNKVLHFKYNACADMEDQSFADFNNDMMNMIDEKGAEKIIIDLRNNTGGDSEILNPFTERLGTYVVKHSDVKVYILVGRNTFSSGTIAIYRVKEIASGAVSVGEPTGGALDCYGDIRSFNLPNSQIPVYYSTKYFELSRGIQYKNVGVETFLPDVTIQPTMEDYKKGIDPVLDYVLADE